MSCPGDFTKDAFSVLMSAGRKQQTGCKRSITVSPQQQKRQRQQRPVTGSSDEVARQNSNQQHDHRPESTFEFPHSVKAKPAEVKLTAQLSDGTSAAANSVDSPSHPQAFTSCNRSTSNAEFTRSCTLDSRQAAVAAFQRVFSQSRSQRNAAAQKFDYLLVYDFEATTNQARTLHPIEIIEFSCVIVRTATASITSSFQSFVRPTEHPQLDPFAIQLCGIQQHQVDSAPLLADVLQQHHEWLQQQGVLADGVTCVPVTWTDWDLKVALCSECGWRHIQRPPYLCRWVDLKRHFRIKYRKAGNLKTCVEAAGLRWTGRAHSGLDDATNTANLAIHLMRQGVQLEVTQVSENLSGSSASNQPLQAGSQNVLGASQAKAAAAAAGSVDMDSAQAAESAGTSKLSSSYGFEPSSNSSRPLRTSHISVSMTQLAAQKGTAGVFDASGKWLGRCFCGTKAKSRVTKRPGQNHGRQFWSCGCWTITAQQSSSCGFFLWADEVPSHL